MKSIISNIDTSYIYQSFFQNVQRGQTIKIDVVSFHFKLLNHYQYLPIFLEDLSREACLKLLI